MLDDGAWYAKDLERVRWSDHNCPWVEGKHDYPVW